MKLKKVCEFSLVKNLVDSKNFRRINRKGNIDYASYMLDKINSYAGGVSQFAHVLPRRVCSELWAVGGGINELNYGAHFENSDIFWNNKKQWDFLEDDNGDKLRAAMDVLGVVSKDGKKGLFKKADEGVLVDFNLKEGNMEKSKCS